MFGLSATVETRIKEILQEFQDIEMAYIYGSRAMGNFKKGSDVDLAIFGNSLRPETQIKLSYRLNQEAPLPYHFDVTDMLRLEHQELRRHIQTSGKLFYQRESFQG